MSLFLFLLVVAAPPLADDATYQEGVRLFEEFEYERAVFRFEEALRDTTRSDADRATVLVRLGMTRAELRDDARAIESFEQALMLDPYVTLPSDASPKIRELLDEGRKRVRDGRARPPDDAPAVASPTPAPAPVAPAPSTTAPASEPAAVDDGAGAPLLLYTGAGLLAVGAVVFVVAALAWGGGVGLALYASGLEFQSDAATYALPATVAQVGGQVALGVALLVVLAGAGTTVAHVVVE